MSNKKEKKDKSIHIIFHFLFWSFSKRTKWKNGKITGAINRQKKYPAKQNIFVLSTHFSVETKKIGKNKYLDIFGHNFFVILN